MNMRIMRSTRDKLPEKRQNGTGVENLSTWLDSDDPTLGVWVINDKFISVSYNPQRHEKKFAYLVNANKMAKEGAVLFIHPNGLSEHPRLYVSNVGIAFSFTYKKQNDQRNSLFFFDAMKSACQIAIPGSLITGNDILLEGKKIAGCVIMPRAIICRINIIMDYDLYDSAIKSEYFKTLSSEGKTAREYTTDLTSINIDKDDVINDFIDEFARLCSFDTYEEKATENELNTLDRFYLEGFPKLEISENLMVQQIREE